MLSADYRSEARNALGRVNWWPAIMVSLVAAILGDGMNIDFNINNTTETWDAGTQLFNGGSLWAFLVGTVSILAIVYFLLSITIGSVIRVGHAHYYIRLLNDEYQSPFNTLFYPFRYWSNCLALGLLTAIKTFLWGLLLIIPGIIASFSYAMAPYIMAEDPTIPASEALSRSTEMMRGNRMRLFMLNISFIGWILLSAVSFGLGFILLNPYMNAANASFYLSLKGAGSRLY